MAKARELTIIFFRRQVASSKITKSHIFWRFCLEFFQLIFFKLKTKVVMAKTDFRHEYYVIFKAMCSTQWLDGISFPPIKAEICNCNGRELCSFTHINYTCSLVLLLCNTHNPYMCSPICLIMWVERWIITRCSSEQRIFRIPCSLELQAPPFRRVIWAVDQFSSTFRAILWAVDPSSNHFLLSCGWHKSLINPTSYMLIEDARMHTANQ